MKKKSFNLLERLTEKKKSKEMEFIFNESIKEKGVPFSLKSQKKKNKEDEDPEGLELKCQYLSSKRKGQEVNYRCNFPKHIEQFLNDERYTLDGKTFTTKGANLISCKGCPQALVFKFLKRGRRR